MSSVKQEQQHYKVNPRFERYSRIGDPEGIVYIARCLNHGTTSTQSLKTLAQSEIGKKAIEVELSLLLLSAMGLVLLSGDTVSCTDKLLENYEDDDKAFREWFVDEFIDYVMRNDIIDIETITYEISSDSYLMSPSCIKRKYSGFRNMLVDFEIIALRADTKYTILQKLDKYITRPEVRRKITEKQLFAQLQKKKELGNSGEEWVLGFEKNRISDPKLNKRIKRISLIDVAAGYDIVSFNSNESVEFDRFIEVKTYKGNEHFHWSHNEIEKASLMGDQYYLYLVDADCLGYDDYEPKMIQDPIKRIGESEGWAKRPDSYLVERVVEAKNGNILPLFTNVDNSMPIYRHMQYEPYHPTIEISTPEIKIAAKTIKHDLTTSNKEFDLSDAVINVNGDVKVFSSQYDIEPSYAMVAEPVDVMTLSPKTRKDILKISLEKLFIKGDYKDRKLFMRAEQWIGVYRNAVELCFSIENDYNGFVDQINSLGIDNIPFTCKADILEKFDKGVFQRPVEEWTFELYKSLNNGRYEKTFKDLNSVAKEFALILKSNIPQKRVVAANENIVNFNGSVGIAVAHAENVGKEEDEQ